jgi:hypothetical protein
VQLVPHGKLLSVPAFTFGQPGWATRDMELNMTRNKKLKRKNFIMV